MSVSIYALRDPRSTEARYVGKTAVGLANRLRGELDEARRGGVTKRNTWIRSVLADGIVPEISLICEVDDAAWEHAETYWIAHFKAIGHRLTNMTPGGDGLRHGSSLSPEVRAKIAASLVGRPVSPETRERISTAQRGRSVPMQRREQIAQTLTGRKRSFDVREKTRATWQSGAARSEHVMLLTKSVPRELLLERAAKGKKAREQNGTSLAFSPKLSCVECRREMRPIDMPRHRCERSA